MPNSKKNYVPVARQVKRQVSNVEKAQRIHERRQRLLSLRQAGASYSEIVRANIGYNSTAHVAHDMKIVLEQFNYETPEDVLVLDLARLDEMQKILTAEMRSGDGKGTVPILLRVMQFRRETLGVTTEQIAERQMNKTQVNNNGIMVVQGTTGDYVRAMAAAVGADPEMVSRELESVSESNKSRPAESDIIDAEIIPDTPAPKKKKRYRLVAGKSTEKSAEKSPEPLAESFESRLMESAERHDREDSERESTRAVEPSEPLLNVDMGLNIDIPGGVDYERAVFNVPQKMSVPVKPYDHNVPLVSGIPYQVPPKKMSPAESKKILVRKLKKSNVEMDDIERETIQEIID